VSTSLVGAPVGEVLEQLLADAARTQAEFRSGRPPRPEGNQQRPDRDEREFFTTAAKNVHLAVSRQTGTLLYTLARTRRAQTVVEFGTSFGVSLIYLAAAVKDNGGGIVIGTEYEPGKVVGAQRAVDAAGLSDQVEIREGDAVETLKSNLPESVDLLFLDGAKGMYCEILSLLSPRLAPGAIVVADNASRGVGYLDHVRASPDYLSTGFAEADVEISLLVR